MKVERKQSAKLARLAALLTLFLFVAPLVIYEYSPKSLQAQYYLTTFEVLLPGSLLLILLDQFRNLHRRRTYAHTDSASAVQKLPTSATATATTAPILVTSQTRILRSENPPVQLSMHTRLIGFFVQILTDPLVASRAAIISLLVAAPLLLALPPKGLAPFAANVAIPTLYPTARWDSYYYLRIAKDGYTAVSGWSTLAFRPLFPLILRILYPSFRMQDPRAAATAAALVWNLVAVAIAGFYMEKLTKLFLGPKAARRALVLLAVYPSTFFLSVVYSEATTILLVVASIYYLETRKPIVAGVLGFLAGLARPETFLLSGAFFVKALVSPAKRWTRSKMILASGLTALSLPVFLAFSYIVSGSFLTPARVEAGWQKCSMICFMNNPVKHFFSPTNTWPFTINMIVMALSIIFIGGAFIRTGVTRRVSDRLFPYYLWSLALIGIIFYVGEIRSWARFQLGIPAVFWAQARYGVSHPRIFALLVVFYAALMILATVLWANWYPML